MILPKAFLEEMRARVVLSDIIGKRMKLIRAGREFKGCCPFHKEKTPSFYVNDQKGFYHCFGCGVHGDCIRFLTDHDNLRFMDAVEQLAGIAGLQVPKPTPADEMRFKREMSLYDMMEVAAKWYETQLYKPENKKILHYLLERGLSSETIKAFRLGFAPQESETLSLALIKQGFSQDDLIEAGLFRASDHKKGEVYGFFRNRVMFPVTDFQGRIVAFGGRVLPGADKAAPKYVNSPENPIFHKGHNLYALSRARKPIGDGETAIVVEGYMDVIALHQAGFRGTVAPLGTALTETQIEMLWKTMPEGSKSPVLCFDGDAAGQRAAGRSLNRVLPILKPDHTVRFAFLPSNHDPDSLIKEEGRGAMERVIAESASLFDTLWGEEAKERALSSPEAKAGLKSSLINRAKQISDMSVQEFFIHEINQKIKRVFLSHVSDKKNLASSKKTPFAFKRKDEGIHAPLQRLVNTTKRPKSIKFMRERILIAAMILHPRLYEEFSEQFGLIAMDGHDYGQLRQDMIRLLDQQNDLDYQAVKQHLIDVGHAETLKVILDRSLYLHAGFAKPEQPYEIVRQGWQDTYDRGQSKGHSSLLS